MDRSSDAGFAIGGTKDSIAGATTNERSMLVACKK